MTRRTFFGALVGGCLSGIGLCILGRDPDIDGGRSFENAFDEDGDFETVMPGRKLNTIQRPNAQKPSVLERHQEIVFGFDSPPFVVERVGNMTVYRAPELTLYVDESFSFRSAPADDDAQLVDFDSSGMLMPVSLLDES